MLTRQFVSHVTLRRDTVTAFDAYPFSLPAVRALDTLELHPKVTFLVGENGSGKSTLMEAIAVALGFNAEGGSRNFNFSTHASHSELHAHLRIARGFRKPRTGFFLRAESFYNVASEIERLDVGHYYGDKLLHAQSHGESFLALLMHRFGDNGLYLLDEPEAALSPQRQLAVLTRLHDLVQAESQFLIATHSPILMAYPDAWIYQCDGDGIRRIAYEETAHFQVTRDFLANPQRMLNMLLEA
jgi:predicted ATPase